MRDTRDYGQRSASSIPNPPHRCLVLSCLGDHRQRGTARWADLPMTATASLSLDQFLRIPEQEPALEFDSDGTIHEKMSPNTEHGALQAHLARLLLNWIDVDPPRRRGYVFTELRTNVAGASKLPDLAFYR